MPIGQTPISGLPAGSTPGGTEIFPADQAGVTSKFTFTQLAQFVPSQPVVASWVPSTDNTFNLGSPSDAWAQLYLGPNHAPVLDTVSGNIGYYARTAAETIVAVTPVDFSYPSGDVRRYGAVGNGTTDDSTAVSNALLVGGTAGGPTVVLPAGYKFKITSYLPIYSNTTVYILGTLQLTNRASGLFANGASNIGIYGFGTGQLTDTTVATQVFATITAITQATQAVVTVSTVSGSNPFSVGQQVGISGVFGMTQINGLAYVVQSIGGASGAWTITLNVNSTTFTAYSSGGVANSGYFFNSGQIIAPAIHLRSVTRVLIDGLLITNTAQGILTSNATTNSMLGAGWILTQAVPTHVKISNCRITFTEWSGLSCYVGIDIIYTANYVYRNGDGGIWMMGAVDAEFSYNIRLSPYASPGAVATFGYNNMQQITTWNDEQGIELEACHGALVTGNVVKGFWSQGIDIKNECNQVLVTNNRVSDCENASIVVRQGESAGVCHKIDIIANTVSNAGTSQFNVNTGILGAIVTEQAYLVNISDNIIYSYGNPTGAQPIPAIACYGPAPYLASQFPSNPHEASLVVRGNRIEFKAFLGGENVTDFGYTANTQNAIAINGQYDSVHCCDNSITADYFSSSDARINTIAAILLDYISANSTFYPQTAQINDNMISGWGGYGIVVTGLIAMTQSGLSVCDNSFGVVGGVPISVSAANYCNISGNTLSQQNGANNPGIIVAGSAGNLVQSPIISGNMIGGGWNTGGNGMQYAITVSFVNNANLTNNTTNGATNGTGVAAINIPNCTGNLVMEGTTGWPRSGAASPAGSVGAYWQGEQYLDTATPAFYWATSTVGTTTWVNS